MRRSAGRCDRPVADRAVGGGRRRGPAGGAILSNGALAFGALNLVDSFAAESLNGNLSVGQIAVTGNGQGISLRATKGTLSVQNNLSTSGDVTWSAARACRWERWRAATDAPP